MAKWKMQPSTIFGAMNHGKTNVEQTTVEKLVCEWVRVGVLSGARIGRKEVNLAGFGAI